MNNYEVSIYVPVYNGQSTIESCINSILSQTVKPNKILVINDNSTDKTAEILKKYEDQAEKVLKQFNDDIITEDERKKAIIEIWNEAT